jgi:hypothetical protein
MKQPYSPLRFCLLSGMLIILVLCFAVPAPAQAPSIEGTYQLVSRKLPDGTVQSPPHIMGALTYTKTHRNFNVIWRDAQGKFFSYSLVSTYGLTPTEYSETILFSILNDQISGKEIVYNLSRPTQSVPAKVEGKRIQFKLPFDPPSAVFEGDKMTATAEGQFVDGWEKVQ